MSNGIENAGVLFSARQALFGICSVAEQTLESHARVHFSRQRLGCGRPRYGVGVRAAIAPVAIAEVRRVFDAKLNGGQYRVATVLVRNQLVDRDAQIGTNRVS